MNTENILTEWKPMEGFNILDFRDFKDFPLYDTPPYILKFRFSSIQEPLELKGLGIDLMGWNIPECQTETLFSKIQVSKNNFQDVYYNQSGGKMGENRLVLRFEKTMVLRSPNDILMVAFFPLCPVHMVDVGKVEFLTITDTTTKPPVLDDKKDNTKEKEEILSRLTDPRPLGHFWYIYATLFVMVLLLMICLLFMTINQKKKYYLVVRDKK